MHAYRPEAWIERKGTIDRMTDKCRGKTRTLSGDNISAALIMKQPELEVSCNDFVNFFYPIIAGLNVQWQNPRRAHQIKKGDRLHHP
jgi:hypothetical protein